MAKVVYGVQRCKEAKVKAVKKRQRAEMKDWMHGLKAMDGPPVKKARPVASLLAVSAVAFGDPASNNAPVHNEDANVGYPFNGGHDGENNGHEEGEEEEEEENAEYNGENNGHEEGEEEEEEENAEYNGENEPHHEEGEEEEEEENAGHNGEEGGGAGPADVEPGEVSLPASTESERAALMSED